MDRIFCGFTGIIKPCEMRTQEKLVNHKAEGLLHK